MYSFHKEKAAKYSNSTGMISADTKWKLSVGERCEQRKSCDCWKEQKKSATRLFEIIGHSRCCSSRLQYRKRITKNGGDAECNTDAAGKRLSEKVLYSVKDMATQGSSAIRGVTESSM